MHHGRSGNALVNGGVGKTFWMVKNITLRQDGLAYLKVGNNG
eukprot:COSAG03_NODE_15162_length_439_cov_1.370588_1_plen_41_part_10